MTAHQNMVSWGPASKGQWTHMCEYLVIIWYKSVTKGNEGKCQPNGTVHSSVFCSKKRKKKSKTLKEYYEELYEQNDDGLKWDSQDSADHKCWPEDPQAMTESPPRKKRK